MLWSKSASKIRRARLSDAESLMRVQRESWMLAYRGIIPHDQLKAMVDRRSAAWWRGAIRSRDHVLALDVDGSLAGYATCGRSRHVRDVDGEIYELYLAPNYQGLGFGELVFEACRATLDRRSYRGLVVQVLSENEQAVDFYWARGGRPTAETFERFGETLVSKLTLTWD
ncbi:MAG: GNAT family N-acetyltransferase [Pseudomonadota bacterium]